MSGTEILVILIGLGIIIAVLKLIKGVVKLIVVGILILLTCGILVMYVPESQFSMAVTKAIAQHVTIDQADEYDDGDLISEFEASFIELDSYVLTAVTRNTALALSKTKIDHLLLKDAVIYFTPTSGSVDISIYKVE